jgi:membrane protease YdiL (CAAX protease family)
VCEEILFRGAIQRGFEKLGAIKSIILTAFLFGLMHQDFQKLLGTFLLGCIIGFIVYRSDSIIGGMFAHFTNIPF